MSRGKGQGALKRSLRNMLQERTKENRLVKSLFVFPCHRGPIDPKQGRVQAKTRIRFLHVRTSQSSSQLRVFCLALPVIPAPRVVRKLGGHRRHELGLGFQRLSARAPDGTTATALAAPVWPLRANLEPHRDPRRRKTLRIGRTEEPWLGGAPNHGACSKPWGVLQMAMRRISVKEKKKIASLAEWTWCLPKISGAVANCKRRNGVRRAKRRQGARPQASPKGGPFLPRAADIPGPVVAKAGHLL